MYCIFGCKSWLPSRRVLSETNLKILRYCTLYLCHLKWHFALTLLWSSCFLNVYPRSDKYIETSRVSKRQRGFFPLFVASVLSTLTLTELCTNDTLNTALWRWQIYRSCCRLKNVHGISTPIVTRFKSVCSYTTRKERERNFCSYNWQENKNKTIFSGRNCKNTVQ